MLLYRMKHDLKGGTKQKQIFKYHMELMILIATEKSMMKIFRKGSFSGKENEQKDLTEKQWL